MKTVATPELAVAVGPLTRLIESADKGTADVKQGQVLIGATDKMCKVIKTDVDRRIRDVALREAEAKMVEANAEKPQAIEDQSQAVDEPCPTCGKQHAA